MADCAGGFAGCKSVSSSRVDIFIAVSSGQNAPNCTRPRQEFLEWCRGGIISSAKGKHVWGRV